MERDSVLQKLERIRIKEFLETYEIDEKDIKEFEFFLFKESVWMTTKEVFNFNPKGIKIVRKGLRVYRIFEHSLKPTTSGIQIIGKNAKKKKVYLNPSQALKFMKGEKVEISSKERGFVIVCFKDTILGVGLLKNKELKSQVPRSKRILKDFKKAL